MESADPSIPVLGALPTIQVDYEKIPSKMAFKIGEVADIVGVKPYVLRYWETEFEALRPQKSKSNQRVYHRRDVETALLIKTLLHKERYSIEGARSALRRARGQVRVQQTVKHQLKQVEQSQSKVLEKAHLLLEEIQGLKGRFEP